MAKLKATVEIEVLVPDSVVGDDEKQERYLLKLIESPDLFNYRKFDIVEHEFKKEY